MRLLSLPARPRALLFDIDGTLYSDPAYMAFQEDVLVERLAAERGEAPEATRRLVAELRAGRAAAGLGKTSLGRIFAELGCDIRTSVRWRIELIEPGKWLSPDPNLGRALASLASRYAIAAVTNNPRAVGEKALAALGVAPAFGAVVGLDDTMASKPAPEPFLRAAALLGVEPAGCVSVGDRRDVDLEPALALGMGAILVDGVEDLYTLPAALGLD